MRQSYNRDASQASGQRGRWHKADGSPNSEDRALQRFADMMIEKLQDCWTDASKTEAVCKDIAEAMNADLAEE